MVLWSICNDYIESKKSLFYTYAILASGFYIFTIIILPILVSKISYFIENYKRSTLIMFALVFLIISALIWVTKLKIETFIIPDIIKHIRCELIKKFLYKNKVNFSDTNTTLEINKIFEMTENTTLLIKWILTDIVPLLIVSFFIILYMFYRNKVLGLITLICNIILVYYPITQLSSLYISHSSSKEHNNTILKKLDNIYTNMFNIYINNKVEDTITENNKIGDEYLAIRHKYNIHLVKFIMGIRAILYIFFVISCIFIYTTSIDDDYKSLIMVSYLYTARIDSILEMLPTQLNKTFDLKLESSHYETNSIAYESISSTKGHLEVKNLTFAYKSSPTNKIFDNYSIEIKPGERVGITGKTGTGKSTLLKLFLRFYEPLDGVLLLDGKDIQTINPDDIRKHLYYINQKTMLFDDTILENIRYGTTKTEEEVYSILTRYNLLNVFQSNEPKILNRMVQTNGSNISMGMQKVIFLVRGMLQDVPVYFIDEPFTSIDENTRNSVQEMIDKETKGKTVVIITHDIKKLDTILDRIIPLR